MKKFLAILLAVALTVSCLCVNVFAADDFATPMELGLYVHEGDPIKTVSVTGYGTYTLSVTDLSVSAAQWLIVKNTDAEGWPPAVQPSDVPDGTLVKLSLKINDTAVTFNGAETYEYTVANGGIVEINVWNNFASSIEGISFDKSGTINSVEATVEFIDPNAPAEPEIPDGAIEYEGNYYIPTAIRTESVTYTDTGAAEVTDIPSNMAAFVPGETYLFRLTGTADETGFRFWIGHHDSAAVDPYIHSGTAGEFDFIAPITVKADYDATSTALKCVAVKGIAWDKPIGELTIDSIELLELYVPETDTPDNPNTPEEPEVPEVDETLEYYNSIKEIPVGVQAFAQDTVSWGWNGLGYASNTFGNEFEADFTVETPLNFNADNTDNFTREPSFGIQIDTSGFLKVPEDAEVGDTGDRGRFGYTYGDITITAEGYDDVVIPGNSVEQLLVCTKTDWGTGGDSIQILFANAIKDQLGISDIAAYCEYLNKVTNINFTLTFNSYNGITPEIIEDYILNGPPEAPVRPDTNSMGYIVTGPNTHAVIIGGAIITTEHVYVNGVCPYCGYLAPATDDEAVEPAGPVVIASAAMSASGNVDILNGVDFADENLTFNVNYTLTDASKAGWGVGAICDSNWTSIVSIDVNETGVLSISLVDLAAAASEAGVDLSNGVIINWWGDYATLHGVELVSTAGVTSEDIEIEAPVESGEEEVETDDVVVDENPTTGVALALVPAALALAVVTLKRR